MRQLEETDCGVSCLATVLEQWGGLLPSHALRALLDGAADGTSLLQLRDAAQALGFQARGVRCDDDETLETLTLPAILHWQENHFVVLHALRGARVAIADPALGLRWVRRSALWRDWNGNALELIPTQPLPREPSPSPLWRWLPLVWESRRTLGVVALLSLLLDGLGLLTPMLTERVIDSAITTRSVSMLQLLLAGMLAVTLGQVVMEGARGLLQVRLGNRLDRALLDRFFRHLMRLPPHVLEQRRVGDLLARFGDATQVRELVTGTAVGTMLDLGLTTVYLWLMFRYQASLTWTLLAWVPLFAALSLLTAPRVRVRERDWLIHAAAVDANLVEALGGARTVRALGLEERFRAQWEETYVRAQGSGNRATFTHMQIDAATTLLYRLASLVLLYRGSLLVMQGALTLGQLMAFNVLLGAVMGPIGRSIRLWENLQHSLVFLERMAELLDTPAEAHGGVPAPSRADLHLADVTVCRGGARPLPVLNDVTLTLRHGERVGVLGPSGSGKSTLLSVMLGLLPPTRGRVTLGGTALAEIDRLAWRLGLGVVLQDASVFAGTILHNIIAGDPKPDMERVAMALQAAFLTEVVDSLPQGLSTRIGERGTRLSGGQCQRLALARALYRSSEMLLLDEATSHQDAATERRIVEGLLHRTHGDTPPTMLMIGHHLPCPELFDRIVIIEEGRVTGDDHHRALLEHHPMYASLLSAHRLTPT